MGKKKTGRVEIDALFGLMYFRGIFGVNLDLTDRLFSNDSHFVFGAIMSKNCFRFLKSHICFKNPQERSGKQIDSSCHRDLGKLQFKSFKPCHTIGISFNL